MTLSLQECYQRAVRQSERLGISREEIRAAEGRYQQAIATLVPKVVIRTGAQWQDRPIFAFGAEPKETSTSLSLWIRQPLFNGFREFHAASAGRAEIRRRIFDEVRARQELYIDIITLGRQILYYEKDLKLLAEMEQVLNRRVEDLKRRVELGQSRPGELLQSKSEVANLRVTTQRIQGFLHASRELMAFLIGLPASSWTLRDNWSWPRLEALEEYLKKTETRPDLLAAIEAERSARSLLKAKQAETYPSINIETHIYLYEDPKAPRDWNVFLSAALPIFDFIEIGGRVKEQKAALQQSRLSLERLRRTADQEVRTAFSNFNALVAQIVELREAERLAIENLKVQEEDYTLGRVTNLDVIDALRRKLDLQRQKISAETEALIEYERLHVAAGGSRL
ncbi:MAG: TolC family protein [Methylacidiphilales bacterium]|nr:TolC family protein [Candidatus Methylacidiphilales bacterium]